MNKKGFWIGVIVVMIVLLAVSVVAYNVAYAFTSGTEVITVNEKWSKVKGDDAKYLVSSEDGQVFQVTDSWIKLRFDSSNLYANLDEGETYNVKTQGWRFAFLSDYKNILEIESVD